MTEATVPRFDYCFIITFGRSGSTLLQGILNAIPGYLIRGENAGALAYLQDMVETTMRHKHQFSDIDADASQPWFGMDGLERSSLLAEVRRMFIAAYIRPGPEHRCVGYKEIRYGAPHVANLADHIDFMAEVFPNACFIFNARDAHAAAASGYWRTRNDALNAILEARARMADVCARRPGDSIWVDYESYANDLQGLAPLFDFLGEDFDTEAMAAVMARPHSVADPSPSPLARRIRRRLRR